jgi:hypothetical protein
VLTPAELGCYNREMRFVVEPGAFKVWVGSSSEGGLEEGSRFNSQWTALPCSCAQDRHACGSAIHSGGIRRSQYSQVR